MRLTEVLRSICNKFIRQDTKKEPESNQISPEPLSLPKLPEEVQVRCKPTEHERKIRRYRAFAYHHKKKRIRKKYTKMLLEISPVDRFVSAVNQGGIRFSSITWSAGSAIGVDYSSRKSKSFAPGSLGSRKGDHGDCRRKGGVR